MYRPSRGDSWMRRYMKEVDDRQYKGDWRKKSWLWRYRAMSATYWRGKRYE